MKTKDKNDTINKLAQINIESDPSNLVKIYGSRFNRAWQLLKDRKIIKYVFLPSKRVRWLVEGNEHNYLILTGTRYCDCLDFYYGIVYGPALACQHLIAQRMADVLGDYQLIELDDALYCQFMERWRNRKPVTVSLSLSRHVRAKGAASYGGTHDA